MNKLPERIRIKDIARLADVSVGTVDRVIFSCLLPQHLEGEYWTAVEKGINEAITTYSDFHISVKTAYYDPYDYTSFLAAAQKVLSETPDGVIFAPTAPQFTKIFTDELDSCRPHANDDCR